MAVQRKLVAALWERRDSTLSLYQWLEELGDSLLNDLIAASRTLQDEEQALAAFVDRTADGGDRADMSSGQFAGQGEGNNRIHLSTLHSSRGREFSVVIMFGMDDGRIPRANSAPHQLAEAPCLFYVGFTRAKTELHIMFSSQRPSPFVSEVEKRLTHGT